LKKILSKEQKNQRKQKKTIGVVYVNKLSVSSLPALLKYPRKKKHGVMNNGYLTLRALCYDAAS